MPRGPRRSHRLSTEMLDGPTTNNDTGLEVTSCLIISMRVYVFPVFISKVI